MLWLLLVAFALAPAIASAASPSALPSNIVAYSAITLTNAQTTATPANFQQMLTFNALALCTPKFCAPHLNNTEFFYANGTVIPSWLESGAGITNNYGSNDIASSSNVIAWVKLAPSGFIPASGSNTIYMGFAANTVNLFSNTITGEAPQLSSTYAQYDDGAEVFTNYWNFAGTTLPSGWTGSAYLINNGISAPSSSWAATTATYALGNVLEWYGNLPTGASGYANRGIGFINSAGVLNTAYLGWYDSSASSPVPAVINAGTGATFTNVASGGTAVWSIYWASATTANFSVNYGSWSVDNVASTAYPPSPQNIGIGNNGATSTIGAFYWVRQRIYPPNGLMPSVTFGAVQLPYTPPTVSVSPTSQTLDIPQSITLTATVSNGTTPYSYQWYNDTTGTPSAISGATSSTYTVVSGATGTFEYFVSVTDAHPTTVNSTNVIIIVNSALLANPITPSSPIIDNGQSITLTANPSGGTTSYSYQWYNGTSATCSSDTAIGGATSSTYTASPTSNTYYCYTVTDSATTPETNTSTTNLITVNPTLTATISPTTTNTYTYLTTTLTATASGGTPSYSYQWYNDTSGTPSAISGATSSTYNVAFSSAGTYVFFANVKDNSQGTPTASVNTSNATINVNLAFSELNYYFTNSSPLIYPAVPSFNVTAIDQANDTITLNASLISSTGDEVFHDTSYINDTNTTINSSNSTLTLGSLSAGTYTIYFNASDALGAYILNQTNFTIQKATPSLSLSVPSSYVYNNINQNIIGTTNVPYATNNSDLVSNLFLNGTQVDTLSQSSDSSSLTYIQTGTNLAVNTYTYVWNTTGNQNYTSASATGTFSITKASPILLLTVPANFTYNGTNGVINFGVNDINQQVLANLELNYSAYTLPAFDYDNVVANTTTNSTYGIPNAGIYNTTLYSQATQNYTANSTNVFWNITQAQGNAILQLNGTQANYTIYQHETIPINASSTTSNNIQLFQNGTLISSQDNTTNPLT